VLAAKDTSIVKGYYTLSNNSIPLSSVPEYIQKKLPKSYISIPTTLPGRLANIQTANFKEKESEIL